MKGDTVSEMFSWILILLPQGSSVLEAILADGEFSPRAITRDSRSDAARKLSLRGIQVVEADLLDVNSLRVAFSGCECVFAVRITQQI